MLIDPKNPWKSRAAVVLFFVIAAGTWSNAFFSIFSTLFIVCSLISVFQTRDFRVFRNGLAILAAFFVLMNLLSLTQTQHLGNSVRGVLKVLRSVALCLSVVHVVDTELQFKRVFQAYLVTALVIGLDALLQGVTGYEVLMQRERIAFWVGKAWRITGPFHHPNDFSAYLSLVIFLFIGALAQGTKTVPFRRFIFYSAGLLVTGMCLLGTYSRGAWVAVFLTFVLMSIFLRSRWAMLVMVGMSCLIFFVSPPSLQLRIQSLFNPKTGTLVERAELWRESLRMIQAKPLLGHGPNTYSKTEPLFKSADSKVDDQYAHNGYLHLAAEIGLLGLLSFLSVVFYFFKETLPSFLSTGKSFLKAAGLGLVFGIFSFLIHSATDTDLQSLLLVNLFWISVGTAWAAKNCLEKP
jgi:putative inorganic carbon (HCO3(-)) transporter